MYKCILTAILFMLPHKAFSGISGNDLYEWCIQSGNKSEAACIGYIIGSVETIGTINSFFETCLFYHVIPDINGHQYIDIVIKGLKDNPSERNRQAIVLIAKYINEAFPCPDK